MNKLVIVVGSIAGAGGSLILLVCGPPLSLDLPLAMPLFSLCLAIVAIASGVLFWRGSVWPAVIALIVMLALLLLSFRPVYAEHWVPWENSSHRHMLWELGHVH